MSDWMNWQDLMQASAPQMEADNEARQQAALDEQGKMNALWGQLQQQQATAMSNETFGGRKYDGDVTKLGAYSDIMKAQNEAQLRLQQRQTASTPWEKDMQGQAGIQTPDNPWDKLAKRMGGLKADAASWRKSQVDQQAAADKAAEADKARRAQDEQRKAAFREQLKQKFREYWESIDSANNNFFGSDKRHAANFTVYSGEGFVDPSLDPDAQRLSQMGRNAGLDDDVNKFNAPATYVFGQRTKGGY